MSVTQPLSNMLVAPDGQIMMLILTFAAVFLLDAFDILLPRGDSMSVSGALVASGIVILGPLRASLVALAALAVANVARWSKLSPRAHLSALATRAAGLAVGAAVFWAANARGDSADVVVAAFVTAAYLLAELMASQAASAAATRRPLRRLMRGNFGRLSPLMVAQVSTAVLTVIIYPEMRAWGLIPVVLLLLIMRQSYALLFDMRETYRTTVLVLVESAESQDPRRVGHADRTASIARNIGMRIGLSATEVERISYAALLHDVDALSEVQPGSTDSGTGSSSRVLRDTTWLADVVPVLEICDGSCTRSVKNDDASRLAAMIVALASDADAAVRSEVLEAHRGEFAVTRVSEVVPPLLKARAVAAALELGYRVSAVF